MAPYTMDSKVDSSWQPGDQQGCKELEHWRRIENLAMVGSRAGEILHDIKNCLFALSGHIEILKRMAGSDHPFSGNLNNLSKASDHMNHLAQMLLGVIRHKEEAVDLVELNTELIRVIDMLPRFSNRPVEICFERSPENCALSARRGDIEQIFTNLMINALDAMPRGGTMQISLQTVHSREFTPPAASTNYAEQYYVISIRDSGQGMTDEVKEHLFELFYTTKRNGTGLGLAIVSRIVTEYDGWITAESQPGCGSTFTVYLPVI